MNTASRINPLQQDQDPEERSSSLREFQMSERDFERVRKLIYARAGIVLSAHKEDMVYSRLSRRLRALGLTRFSDYLEWVEADRNGEMQAFTNSLTTNLTVFFRENHHFEMLSQQFGQMQGRRPKIAIWCAASSTGEEPYSLAICAAEHFQSLRPPVEILATDLDTQVLEVARRGIYPMDRVDKLSNERLKRFFRRGTGANDGYCRVIDELRELILVGASALELKKKAIEQGMITLRRSGLIKAMDGLTTLEEIIRETVL